MKKIVKLLSLVLAFVIAIGVCPVMAEDDKVEIVFCVGDETLLINGEAVTVEKPYVVGDGVTLVPLRVITEAFGAKVDWDGETRSVTLTYPEVSIYLQIDNPVAEVNNKAETLSAAPELTNSVTMVPLRFISENFGADVSYEEDTKKITVIKENKDNGSLVLGAIDSAKIGDSYYNWSMENPVDMQMDERYFDGTYTEFSSADGYFEISISTLPEDYDFEQDFVAGKTSMQGLTLVKAEKDTKNPDKKTMHFQAKDQMSLFDIRQIVTKEYIYFLYGDVDLEKTEAKDKLVAIMDSFDLGFEGDDIYDLSNVEDGMRKFESEEMKVSFDVPQDYFETSSYDEINVFNFMPMDSDDVFSGIKFGVYSKSDVVGAKALAQKDYDNNKGQMNESLSDFCDGVAEKQYENVLAYEYDYTLKYLETEFYFKDAFFEIGDYVYNMSIAIKTPDENTKENIENIMNSIFAEELDSEEIGVLMRNDLEATGTYTSTTQNITLELPNIYQEEKGEGSIYYNLYNGVIITVQKMPAEKGTDMNDVVKTMKEIENNSKNDSSNEVITGTQQNKIGNYKFAHFNVKVTEDDENAYIQQYATCEKDVIYLLSVVFPEISYSERNKQEVLDIIKSMKIK